MLKRYQVLLPEWLEEYITYGVEKYDLNFSELIRLELCLSILALIPEIHPEYKPQTTLKDAAAFLARFEKGKLDREEMLRGISKIYFEARKALDHRKEMLAKKGDQG